MELSYRVVALVNEMTVPVLVRHWGRQLLLHRALTLKQARTAVHSTQLHDFLVSRKQTFISTSSTISPTLTSQPINKLNWEAFI